MMDLLMFQKPQGRWVRLCTQATQVRIDGWMPECRRQGLIYGVWGWRSC